ncbi:MAG: SMI1/KNR4 family protein [Gammaproteobacteria bacterium]|nr:SMI1/KNR4 family protein [Gammaproteobacteria bacterium]
MQTILEKFEKHLKPIDQVKDELYPPASAEEIESVENELAIIFPEDLRTLYKWHNGQVGTYFLFDEFRMYTLEEVVEYYKNGIKHCEPDYFETEDESGVFKDCIANTKWIPIGDNGGNTILFLDMDPGAKGTPGQLLDACDGQPECNYSGIKEFMTEVIRKIEAGEMKWNEDAGSFWPVDA